MINQFKISPPVQDHNKTTITIITTVWRRLLNTVNYQKSCQIKYDSLKDCRLFTIMDFICCCWLIRHKLLFCLDCMEMQWLALQPLMLRTDVTDLTISWLYVTVQENNTLGGKT